VSCVHVVDVHDGDTVKVALPNVPTFFAEMQVRLAGIDAPELTGKTLCERVLAVQARELAKSMLAKAVRIDLRDMRHDKYFRILANVIVFDGRREIDLADEVRKSPGVVDYNGDAKKPFVCPEGNKP
jgi:endonuclease YncB( thermonuclease family)